MIRFSLKCRNAHGFESWFQSGDAYEKLRACGHVTCPVCASADIEKALMAPAVSTARRQQAPEPAAADSAVPVASATSELESRLRALRAHVEANSDYVGMEFAREARAMHAGEAPERPIWGEAKPEEAKALIEDGVPVAPLPFGPPRKTN